MCNRIRGLKEWRDIPRSLAGTLINFQYNPNVAPTEQVPAFIAERDKPVVTRLARFGINLPARDGKKRPPLLNARTDNLRRGSFKTILANRRCVSRQKAFTNGGTRMAENSRISFRARMASRSCSPAPARPLYLPGERYSDLACKAFHGCRRAVKWHTSNTD